jgi:FkbM family methyltransferase
MGITIAGRPLGLIARTASDPAHVGGLLRGARVYRDPARALLRYASASGAYPWTAEVRTPTGPVRIPCRSWHDMVTVHEVYARGDYVVPGLTPPRTILDLGGNIGVVSSWVLSAGPDARAHLVEPVPANLELMDVVLRPFDGRWTRDEAAVGTENGTADFGVEPTGRYGGLDVPTGQTIPVALKALGDIVEARLTEWGSIDLLKIDTEGAELPLLGALAPEHLRHVRSIALEHEAPLPSSVVPAGFRIARSLDIHYLVREDAAGGA